MMLLFKGQDGSLGGTCIDHELPEQCRRLKGKTTCFKKQMARNGSCFQPTSIHYTPLILNHQHVVELSPL
jgi:hypothetical protein